MPGWPERRLFRRYPLRLPFLHEPLGPTPARTKAGWSHDLTQGGACVELPDLLESSTFLHLRLRTEREALEVEARVVWADNRRPMSGGILHGLAFTPVGSDRLLALQNLILSHGVMRRAYVRLPLELTVRCTSSDAARLSLQGLTHNGGRGGLLLRLPQVLAVGTPLRATLDTPCRPLAAEGVLKWVAPPEERTRGALTRHGFQFSGLDWPTALSLGFVLAKTL